MFNINENTIALVIKSHDNWENVCVTEYDKDGVWHSGMNYITSIKELLDCAEQNKLNIIFESQMV